MLLVLAIGGTLYRSPSNAAGWDLTPDAVEYAAGAHRFVTLGRFDIDVCGSIYPSRYLPWFSTLLLAPSYVIAPQQLGAPIIVIWLSAICALLALYYFTKQLAGPWAGVLAVVVLSRLEIFEMMSRLIMSDVPALAMGLLAGVLTVHLLDSKSASTRKRAILIAILAVVGALAGAIRPLYFAVLIPMGLNLLIACIKHRRSLRAYVELATIATPAIVVLILTAIYQHTVFGSISRNGYNFWCPIPYDVPRGTFSVRYFADNLLSLSPVAGLLGLGVMGALLLKKQGILSRNSAWFVLGSAGVISTFHLFYFYPDTRLHMLLIALCVSIGLAGVVSVIPRRGNTLSYAIAVLAFVAIVYPRDPVLPLREDRPDLTQRLAVLKSTLLPRML